MMLVEASFSPSPKIPEILQHYLEDYGGQYQDLIRRRIRQ